MGLRYRAFASLRRDHTVRHKSSLRYRAFEVGFSRL